MPENSRGKGEPPVRKKVGAQADGLRKFIPSRGLVHCELFTYMLAHERRADSIEVCHLLGGMYLANLEKLARYWKDIDEFEKLVATECHVEDTRWFYWMRAYNALGSFWRPSFVGKFRQKSAQVQRVYGDGLQFALSRTEEREHSLPILTPEDLLLAIARQADTDLGKKLTETSLDVRELEQAVRSVLGAKTRMIVR